jgi:hypothetical protein
MYYNSLRDINGEFSQHASMPHHISPLKNNYENYRSSGVAREQGGGGDGAPELMPHHYHVNYNIHIEKGSLMHIGPAFTRYWKGSDQFWSYIYNFFLSSITI